MYCACAWRHSEERFRTGGGGGGEEGSAEGEEERLWEHLWSGDLRRDGWVVLRLQLGGLDFWRVVWMFVVDVEIGVGVAMQMRLDPPQESCQDQPYVSTGTRVTLVRSREQSSFALKHSFMT